MRANWWGRAYVPVLGLLAATGCATGQGPMQHTSTLGTHVNGVAMLDDSSSARVGMAGNTCTVATRSGVIGADYDVAMGEDDNVQDGFGQDGLVVGQSGIYIVDDNDWTFDPRVTSSTVSQARFTDGGFVTTERDGEACRVTWYGDDGAYLGGADLPQGTTCADVKTLSVDRSTGQAFVGLASGTLAATMDGVVQTEGEGDLTAFDAVSGAVYTAATGGTDLAALETDGTTRWSASVVGQIQAVEDVAGMVAVLANTGRDGGEMTFFDGTDGTIVATAATPSINGDVQLAADPSGDQLAVVLPNEVHFFDLAVGQ